MGVLDKLKFWKKDDFSDFSSPDFPDFDKPPKMPDFGSKDSGMDMPHPPSFEPPASAPERMEGSAFAPRAFQERQQFEPAVPAPGADQKMDLISAKLDTIKAQLETVLQRLDRLEQSQSRPYQQRWRNI